jgi:chromosome segregation ATPase
MIRRGVERRLRDTEARLARAREELALLEEQAMNFNDDADEAHVRALVSETPLAEREWHEASRHAEVMARSIAQARQRVADLEKARDELSGRLAV